MQRQKKGQKVKKGKPMKKVKATKKGDVVMDKILQGLLAPPSKSK